MSEEASAAAASPGAKTENPFASVGSGTLSGGSATAGGAFSGGFAFGAPGSFVAPAFGSAPKAAAAADDAGEGGAEDGDGEGGAEEECQAEFKALVELEEVETTTGEEDEDVLLDIKSKLYRYDTESGEWKERGIGQVRLLQHKTNQKVRLLMRQEKTLKIRANHIVMPGIKLQEHAGNEKAWVWTTVDFAEDKQKVEMFCLRFGSVEKAQEFKKKFEEVQGINAELIGSAPESSVLTEAEGGDDEGGDVEDTAASLAEGIKKVDVTEGA